MPFRESLYQYYKDSQVIDILMILQSIADIYVMGGVLRDYKKYGLLRDVRDLDLCIDIKDYTTWNILLLKYPYTKNRFGGYKFDFNGMKIDIWEIQNTWAIRNGLVPLTKPYGETLEQTVFLNIDGLVYDWNRGIWNDKFYQNALSTDVLDIVLEDTPCLGLNLSRAILLQKEYNMKLSNRLKHIITNYTKDPININKIKQIQLRRYGHIVLSVEDIRNNLCNPHFISPPI